MTSEAPQARHAWPIHKQSCVARVMIVFTESGEQQQTLCAKHSKHSLLRAFARLRYDQKVA